MSILNNQRLTKLSALMGFNGSVERERSFKQLANIQKENINQIQSRTLPFNHYCSDLEKQIVEYLQVMPKKIISLDKEISQYIDKNQINLKEVSNINDIQDRELKEMLFEFNSMQKKEKVCQNFLTEIKDTLDFCKDEIEFAFKQSNLVDHELKQLSFDIKQSNTNVHQILSKHLPFNIEQSGAFVSNNYSEEAKNSLDVSLSSMNKNQKITTNSDFKQCINTSPSP